MDGFIPYPDYPYFLDDLWFYNMSSGYWKQMVPVSSSQPSPRTDLTLVLSGRILIFFGGFDGLNHFDESHTSVRAVFGESRERERERGANFWGKKTLGSP